VDALCAQADGMSDLSARIPLYQQAEQLLITQGAAIPYAQSLSVYVVRSHIANWRIAPMGQTPLPVWRATYLRR
jgi:ABC-type transport system substrate-binding protein